MPNPLRRQRAHDGPLKITLRLQKIDDLFAAPNVTPFDPSFSPYSFEPAIAYVVKEMERFPNAAPVELSLLLPEAVMAVDPALEERTHEAIARYARAWSDDRAQEREVGVHQARTVAGSAMLFFAVSQLFSLQYAREGSLLGFSGDVVDIVLDGLGVGAWVALWWPFDQLFQRWQGRLEERTYRRLPEIGVRLLPDANRFQSASDG